MPSVSYDHVWVKAPPPTATSQFVTSDQCLGCHSAGGTGLQYDMTVPGPENKLINLSPYGTWSGSPMRLAGRDPVFFAQLASERETFHPRSVPMIDDTCLGCHGVQGRDWHVRNDRP
jgi:cytochrome c553